MTMLERKYIIGTLFIYRAELFAAQRSSAAVSQHICCCLTRLNYQAKIEQMGEWMCV